MFWQTCILLQQKTVKKLYYKKLDNLIPYTIDNVKVRYYGENCAKGYAAGLDLKFFGEFVPGTDSWISLSLMKAEQTIRETTKAPLPNSPGYNLSVFFQDYFPGYKRVKLNLKGVLSGGLPVTIPHRGYEAGYFRTPAYKRIDLGVSYQLAGGTDAIMDRGFFQYLKDNILQFILTGILRHIQPAQDFPVQFLRPRHISRRPFPEYGTFCASVFSPYDG